jgi:LPXTG-motif cell wall-anchored protein
MIYASDTDSTMTTARKIFELVEIEEFELQNKQKKKKQEEKNIKLTGETPFPTLTIMFLLFLSGWLYFKFKSKKNKTR